MINPKMGRWIFVYSLLLITYSFVHASDSAHKDWTGFYLGAKAGAVSSYSDMSTSAQMGPLFDQNTANTVTQVGQQKISLSGFLSGIVSGYNWQFKKILLGLEADIQSLSTSQDTYSDAIPYSTGQFVITSYSNNNWLLTVRPRLGVISNHWVFYVTGGLGLTLLQSDFIFSNNTGDFESKKVHKIKSGYTIGAGIEKSITEYLSLKTQYLFAQFNRTQAYNMSQNIADGQQFSSSANLKSHLLTLALIYHFNHPSSPLLAAQKFFKSNNWDLDIGTRLFLSSGLDGSPQPLLNSSSVGDQLASRLIFSDLKGISEEVFARVDHKSGVFAKGLLGAGSITSGALNDEDFPAVLVYSNTLSKVRGNLSYATVDVGYSFLKNLFGKLGAFVGYNYFAQNLSAYGCRQIAGSVICVPSGDLANFLGISQRDTFNSLRLGLSSQFNLTKKLSVTSEAAYIPWVRYKGQDIHNARQLIGPEGANHGDGSMLETILNYQFHPFWNLGLGGRYWMWNMREGYVIFDFLGDSDLITEPARFTTERFGVFLQLTYHPKKIAQWSNHPTFLAWKGFFVGGYLGGAWGKSDWSDPFNSTLLAPNKVNIAGFGDRIRLTGPLAGINLSFNGQTNQWVYGVGGSISAANLQGENTLFSGIGGMNGEMLTHYIGAIIGRVGMAFNRSLIYLNAGPAVTNTTYTLNGNTGILSLGTESQTNTKWGWTGGIGIEHALNSHWTTTIEYNYIHIRKDVISFPNIEHINDQQISASQKINAFKLGVNYKFNAFT